MQLTWYKEIGKRKPSTVLSYFASGTLPRDLFWRSSLRVAFTLFWYLIHVSVRTFLWRWCLHHLTNTSIHIPLFMNRYPPPQPALAPSGSASGGGARSNSSLEQDPFLGRPLPYAHPLSDLLAYRSLSCPSQKADDPNQPSVHTLRPFPRPMPLSQATMASLYWY